MTTTLMEAGKEVNPYQLPANGDARGVNCSSKCSLQILQTKEDAYTKIETHS